MQITKPKAILQKVLPLFLSLAMLAGLLAVSPLGTMLINDAEARACRKRSWRRSGGGRPGGRPRLVPGAMPWPPPRGVMCTPGAPRWPRVPAGPTRKAPGADRLMWAPGGSC